MASFPVYAFSGAKILGVAKILGQLPLPLLAPADYNGECHSVSG